MRFGSDCTHMAFDWGEVPTKANVDLYMRFLDSA
jgi:hypothetical protein